jgi:predicted acyl esterase
MSRAMTGRRNWCRGSYKARIELNVLGHRSPAGHRLRVSISTAYWPLIWPSPERTTLRCIQRQRSQPAGAHAASRRRRGAVRQTGSAPLTPVTKVAEGKLQRSVTPT